MKKIILTFLGLFFCLAVLLTVTRVEAKSVSRYILDKDAINSGFTARNSTDTFRVGIQPNSIKKVNKVIVKLYKGKVTRFDTSNETLLSDIHIYKIKHQQKKKFKLKKKVWIQMSYSDIYKNTDKVIKVWNSKKKKWNKLKTKDFSDQLYVSAAIKNKFAVLGVFEREKQTTGDVIQGLASWYDADGAASNDFPYGSTIRVTNISTGVYVDCVVTSTGPFIPGRVVDLTREDFAAIADLSSGIVEVTVQLVE